jgi:hypothetical protein
MKTGWKTSREEPLGRMILKWIPEKHNLKMWTVFN